MITVELFGGSRDGERRIEQDAPDELRFAVLEPVNVRDAGDDAPIPLSPMRVEVYRRRDCYAGMWRYYFDGIVTT